MIEEYYDELLEHDRLHGREQFGLMSSHAWALDPKRLTFTFARYKFVGKLLEGKERVLEVGCADAFATRIVRQMVGHITAIDVDPVFVEDARKGINERWPIDVVCHNMVHGPVNNRLPFNAAYALDVLEHIPLDSEDAFLGNMCASLKTRSSIVIIGCPSLESQHLASHISAAGHVNCKSGPELKDTMNRYFHTVCMFSMNDEVVHTGHHAMAHYLFAVCSDRK